MKKIFTGSIAAGLFLACALSAWAQKKEPWFHLEVKENKAEPEYVKVNLPIGMVDVALDLVKDNKFNKGRMKLDTGDISVADMKKIWNELKKSGDAEFVTVEKKDESVRVAREGNYVIVRVSEKKKSKVDLKVPIAVVDALLAAEGEELDVRAALVAMQKLNVGDVLTVNDNDTHVRIWVE